MRIRKATLQDLQAIQNLNNELCKYEVENGFDTEIIIGWSIGSQSKEYFEDLIKNHFAMVVEIEKEIVGYMVGSVDNGDKFPYYKGKTAEMENTFILKQYRGLGYSKTMVQQFFDFCKDRNATRIVVTASNKNENTIAIYKKLGFEVANVTLKKFL